MTSDSQGPESAKESAVMKCNQAKWNDDKQNRFLVNMPAKEEGSVTAERDCTDKRLPRWFVEQSE